MNISRRKFLGAAGALGGTFAVRSAHATANEEMPSKDTMGMLTDLSLCVGCGRCEWACKEAHGLPHVPLDQLESEVVQGPPRRTSTTAFTVVNRFDGDGADGPTFVKRQCMHCVDPACASACPVKALHKTPEGPIIYNEHLCIGCRYCMVACPFTIPTYEYDSPLSPRVRKCTMCYERFSEGKGLPACAGICPEEAITFGRREDLLVLAHERIHKHPDRYVEHIYGEYEAGGTNWLYISPVPFESLGFPEHLGAKPYPDLTKGYLSLVPLVHTIWPMLLMGLYAFNGHAGESSPRPPRT